MGKNIGVIIPAAGKGKRMGTTLSKQFHNLDGKPIIVHTIECFQSMKEIDFIIVAVDSTKIEYLNSLVNNYRLLKVKKIVEGGKERQDSVWNCLKVLKQFDVDNVIIHDAVRPFISHSLIKSVLNEVTKHSATVVAVRAKDTIKYSSDNEYIEETPKRDNLWIAQTPQAFDYKLIFRAYQKAYKDTFIGTDDVSLVERLGKKIRIVEGSFDNIKITTAEDFELAKLIIKRFVFNCM